MNSDTIYQTISLPVLIFFIGEVILHEKFAFPYVNNVNDREHPELSFTFVHNILRFRIEYFSDTSINYALKGQNIGLISWTHFNIIVK